MPWKFKTIAYVLLGFAWKLWNDANGLRILLKVFEYKLSVEKSSLKLSWKLTYTKQIVQVTAPSIFQLASQGNGLIKTRKVGERLIRNLYKVHALARYSFAQILVNNPWRLRNGMNLTGKLKNEGNTFLLLYISCESYPIPIFIHVDKLNKWM